MSEIFVFKHNYVIPCVTGTPTMKILDCHSGACRFCQDCKRYFHTIVEDEVEELNKGG